MPRVQVPSEEAVRMSVKKAEQFWIPIEKDGRLVGRVPMNRAARRAGRAMERKGQAREIGKAVDQTKRVEISDGK